MDVHLRELRYFLAVAEELNFTRAAERVSVSQPALSKQIRALESSLRTQLFVRDHRTVALTSSGRALVPHASAVMAAWEMAQDAVADAAAAQRASLVVGFSTGVGRGLLPVVRARLAAQMPDARLRMRQVPWDDPVGGLDATGEARTDAAFVWLPLRDERGFEWIEVAAEQRMLAMNANHPLAGSDHITIEDFADEPFLALPHSSGPQRDYWLATDARGRRSVRIAAEISTTDETVEALAAGLGVCLMSAGNVELIARPEIAIRPVPDLSPSRLVFAWRTGDQRQLLLALRKAVQESVTAVTR